MTLMNLSYSVGGLKAELKVTTCGVQLTIRIERMGWTEVWEFWCQLPFSLGFFIINMNMHICALFKQSAQCIASAILKWETLFLRHTHTKYFALNKESTVERSMTIKGKMKLPCLPKNKLWCSPQGPATPLSALYSFGEYFICFGIISALAIYIRLLNSLWSSTLFTVSFGYTLVLSVKG